MPTGYTTYSGYSLRYAYTFRSNYWLKSRPRHLLSRGIGSGNVYLHLYLSFRIPAQSQYGRVPGSGDSDPARTAVSGRSEQNVPLLSLCGLPIQRRERREWLPDGAYTFMGGALLGGAGAALVMSDTIDARLEARYGRGSGRPRGEILMLRTHPLAPFACASCVGLRRKDCRRSLRTTARGAPLPLKTRLFSSDPDCDKTDPNYRATQ